MMMLVGACLALANGNAIHEATARKQSQKRDIFIASMDKEILFAWKKLLMMNFVKFPLNVYWKIIRKFLFIHIMQVPMETNLVGG